MPTVPPLAVLVSLCLFLLFPPTRPCFFCGVLFGIFLLMPIYGGETWARWGVMSLQKDLYGHWDIDERGVRVKGCWNVIRAVCKFLLAVRPLPECVI